ncbi:uncharacterized protein [Paramisgurnus dabryanus]|uniref:uncharacterized protein isoform X3 n=1 Tax=Paramisgurnus dabryanus TaxID=90735 RepID=UPI0031F35710
MEIWKLSAIMFTILMYSVQSLSFTHWISDNWGNDPMDEGIASEAAALLKRSRSHQFYGLMGKRSGLMGRRSLAGPVRKSFSETSTAMNNPVDLNKRSDLQEEWDKLQYY